MIEMKLRVISMLIVALSPAWPQGLDQPSLARRLANSDTRLGALAEVVSLGNRSVPLLLSWTKSPPGEVDRYQLDIGLADAFAELRTTEAIPFLTSKLHLTRNHMVNVWLKGPEVIENELPAAAALISIGPAAAKAVMEAFWESITSEDCPAAIFVVARIVEANPGSVPEARAFLQEARAYLNIERIWAEEGLRALDKQK